MRTPVLALMLLAAAATGACHRHQVKPPPAPQTVTSGSTLQVTAPFTVPGGSSGAYFQDTALRTKANLRPGFPYCHFELRNVAASAHVVEPQLLTVGSVDYEEQAEGPAGDFGSVTYLGLQGGKQTEVRRMVCMLPGEAGASRFLTPAEISGALGDYFKLTVAQ